MNVDGKLELSLKFILPVTLFWLGFTQTSITVRCKDEQIPVLYHPPLQ